jgi:hypothetical protein
MFGGKYVVMAMGTFRTVSAVAEIMERARTGMNYKPMSILAINHMKYTDAC